MAAYGFRLRDSAGTYITDARNTADAQAELVEHFMRPVECWALDNSESKKSPACTGLKSAPGEGATGEN